MSKLTLLLAFHNHQPDGNFDHVFRQAYDDCYRPLLDLLAEFPRVRCSLHHTGPLLEWLDANRPGYLDDLRGLVARGQIEVLGGGFYEPMLAVLPDADALGQMRLMSDFCEARFGRRPRGMWLAERVWEPALAERIARAGLQFTLIDDTHFRYAGVTGSLQGWYVTEKAGTPLAIFPIEKELRYAIPFMPVDQAMRVLDGLAARGVVATYGDDGEKFGLWPGTKDWVWQKGWLRDFFARLGEAGERIECATFSEVLDRTLPTGRVYLPTASYEEMGEWTLPAEAQRRFHQAKERLPEPELRAFLRGGVWQAFMAKYPEANLMHKKMLHVSRKLEGKDLPEARRELYRAQCNCAYWHGLFGGLYLNYLRHAVYAHLIGAEAAADPIPPGVARVERVDFDADLRPEVILATSELWVGIKPDAGGAFFELDARRARFNLTNVLGRHPEAYHDKLREALRRKAGHHQDHGGIKSIHDLAVVKDPNLEELLHYDRHLRLGLLDHFLSGATTIDEMARSGHDERGDFVTGAYELVATRDGDAAVCELRRAGTVRDDAGCARRVTIDKTLALRGGRLACRWRVRLDDDRGGELAVRFAPELSLTLLAGDAPDRRYVAPDRALEDARLVSRGAIEGCPRLELHDGWSRLRVALEASGAPTWWRFPLETASQSEGGFERTYQGSVLCALWPLRLAPGGAFEAELAIDVKELPVA